MRWRQGRRSTNIEDRRGRRIAGGGLRIGGGLGLLILLAIVLLGGDPLQFLGAVLGGDAGGAGGAGDVGGAASRPGATGAASAADDELAEFTSRVLGMTEDTWAEMFAEAGAVYRPPDQRIYIDLGFFSELAAMAGIGSEEFDFAGAYVLAHEVGHHVQNLLGTSDEVRQAQARSPAEANRLSVLLELQADCYAGVWASRTRTSDGREVLVPGDVEEGLRTAAAIGDDRLMRSAGRAVSPESFTHGSSEQRQQWLRTGLETGDVDACDTFARAGYR